jgi:ubiquinone/menaquinone biosynthesis C-methylase UbiE
MAATVDTWDRRAGRTDLYAVLTDRWSPAQCAEVDREQRGALSAVLPALSGSNVLDVGCGIGRLTRWLAGGAFPEWTAHTARTTAATAPARVIGVDYSGKMLARASREVRLANVGFVRACAQHLPFRSGLFDVVVTTSVLQHLTADEDFGRACAQAAQALGPGGVLVCLEGVAATIGSRPTGGTVSATGTGTVRRSLGQFTDALAPWLVLDWTRPLRCVEDVYVVSRWTRLAEVDKW